MNGQFYKNTGYQEPLNLATAPIGNVDYDTGKISERSNAVQTGAVLEEQRC